MPRHGLYSAASLSTMVNEQSILSYAYSCATSCLEDSVRIGPWKLQSELAMEFKWEYFEKLSYCFFLFLKAETMKLVRKLYKVFKGIFTCLIFSKHEENHRYLYQYGHV